MYLILNRQEIAEFLSSTISFKKLIDDSDIDWAETRSYISTVEEKYLTGAKFVPKFKSRVLQTLEIDLQNYIKKNKESIARRRKAFNKIIFENIDYFIEKLGEPLILDMYQKSNKKGFVKSTGLSINENSKLILRNSYINIKHDCLFRNMEGNENLLLEKMKNKLPFWFIDTGYTNFLNGKRKDWHRLTRNHLHHYRMFDAPTDRLGNFDFFPKKWRTDGERILVIEPGSFSASTFNIDIDKWKKDISSEIRKYTDRPILFREKLPKKERKDLYTELCDGDYYCIVNINSNAAIESIWAGIPVITLGKHISNPVSRNKISDINKLYRPNIAEWLCMLSYSQFTHEELINGTAVKILREYHV